MVLDDGVNARVAACPRCGGDFAVKERFADTFAAVRSQLPMATNRLLELLVSLEVEEMDSRQFRSFTKSNHEIFSAGVSEALRLGMESIRPDVIFGVVEAARSFHWRALALERDAIQPGTSPDRARLVEVPTVLRPELLETIRSRGRVAVCSFYAEDRGAIWALVAQNVGADRELGFAQLQVVPKDQGLDYAQKLEAYLRGLRTNHPDFALQRELVEPFGRALLSLFARVERPDELVLIPHGILHVLPLHAASIHLDGKEITIAELIKSVVYASGVADFILGNLRSHYEYCMDEDLKASALVLCAEGQGDSRWTEIELDYYEIMREFAWTVDIIPTLPPEPLDGYAAIFWARGAQSNPVSWSESYLDYGGGTALAKDILSRWRVNRSIVTLSNARIVCSEVIESTGEYCGLDLALRLAGASCVFSGLWKVSAPLAALTASTLFEWVRTYRVSPGEALVRFQRGLRVGDWHRWLLTENQINELPSGLQSRLRKRREAFMSLPADSFREWECWTAYRCFGSVSSSA
jgi:hypothetical protein